MMINQPILEVILISVLLWFLPACKDNRCIKYCDSIQHARSSKVLSKGIGNGIRGYWVKCEENRETRYYVVSINFWHQVNELDSIKKKAGDSVILLYRENFLITKEKYIVNYLNCQCSIK